jgi:DNA-binding NarL/FixJ family response regulator
VIKVFIADDHTIVRHGIRELLANVEDICVAGEAADGRAVLNELEAGTPWDVLVLDLSLPKVDGTEVLRRAKEKRPATPVLILSMYAEEQFALRAVQDGAAGYLSKDQPLSDLLRAIREVAAGRQFLSPAVTAQAARAKEGPAPPHTLLTAREHQIFMLLLQGRTSADIAAELDLNASTVSNNLARIKQKLGVKSVAEILIYGHRAGLIG